MKRPTKFSVLMLSAVLSSMALLLATSTGRAARVEYRYDNAGRLINTSYDTCANTAYTLDAAGNRKTVQRSSGSSNPGVLQFTTTSNNVSESTGSITLYVSRGCGSSGPPVSVSYSIGGTATNGSDYSISGSLSWDAGQTESKTLTVSILDDALVEGNESIVLTLQSPTGGASIGGASSTTITIADNDMATPQWSSSWQDCANAGYCEVSGIVTLTWGAVTGATSYEVEHAGYDYQGTQYLHVHTVSSPSYTEPSRSEFPFGDSFRVRGCTVSGCGSYSTYVNVGTPFEYIPECGLVECN